MATERELFIQKHATNVVQAVKGTTLFASVAMAQMMLESADGYGVPGKGITAVKANNYFGVKAQAGYTGAKMAFNTPKDGKPVSYFRVYHSALDSLVDYTRFLQKNSRYAKHGVFTAATPEAQALAIQKAGFAEGAGYASKLIRLIDTYKLKALDTMNIAGSATALSIATLLVFIWAIK